MPPRLILATSPDAIAPGGTLDSTIVDALKGIRASRTPVGVISNHPKPQWFESSFAGSEVEFRRELGRQDGSILARVAKKLELELYDVLVLAGGEADVPMGKNGGGVLLGAGWSTSQKVRDLGICVADAAELEQVVRLTSAWSGSWWFEGTEPQYGVRSLSDLSSIGKNITQTQFAKKLTATVKNGGARLTALLTLSCRSLMMDRLANQKKLMWGIFPSSSSKNDDSDVLSDFVHRLRTTVSKVHFAERDEPLFIRHTPSAKRSSGGSANRTDPTEQIQTLHLNPEYRSRVRGRNVVLLDDCTTHGLSFGVAAAFLRKAGAASVQCVALGKFGDCLQYYEIELKSDPFAPIQQGGFTAKAPRPFSGTTNSAAQSTLANIVQ